jgi:hypothetical protein
MRTHQQAVRRRQSLIVLVVAVLGLTAIPTAGAAKPIREYFAAEPTLLAAGSGCPFAVELRPSEGATSTRTEFSDGTVVIKSNMRQTVTNLETGASLEVKDAGTVRETYDAAANDLHIEFSGQTIFYFFPGDQGPFGEVGEDGGLYRVVGHVTETWDLDQDLITSFSFQGQATELCSQLD